MEQTTPDSTLRDVETVYPRLVRDWALSEIASAVSSLDQNDGRMPSERDVEAYLLANSLGLKPSIVMTRNDEGPRE